MAKKERKAKVSYCYDRLWEQKLSQVYYLLVPSEDTRNISSEQSIVELIEDSAYENSSHIYEGVFHATEGG